MNSFFKTKNLYTILLISQILDLFNVMVISELIKKDLIYIPLMGQAIIQLSLIIAGNFVMISFVQRFVKSKKLFIAYGIALALSLVFMFIAISPVGASFDAPDLRNLTLFALCCQIISLLLVIIVLINDIFNFKHDLSYSLTGATSIFLLIGTLFACIYCLFDVWSPGMILNGEKTNIFMPGLQYSFYVISGQDPPMEYIDPVIRNFSIFESIFSNLYAVMVVGRLLTK